MATSAIYDVYVIVSKPFSAEPTAAPTTAETLFSGDAKFAVSPGNRIETPALPIVADTRISICGKRQCDGCVDTHKLTPPSPDYEIFRAVAARRADASASARGCVILKSSTVSAAATAAALAAVLIAAEAAAGGRMDLFFFAKWLDRPDQFEVIGDLAGGGKIVRTWNPNGIQALAFTPGGFAKILAAYPPETNPVVCRPFSQVLNTMIQQGGLYAATTTPSLLQYDSTLVSMRATTSSLVAPFSYLKTCETRGDIHPERPLNRRISADLSLFWVVIIVIVVSISAWVLLKVGAFYKTM